MEPQLKISHMTMRGN